MNGKTSIRRFNGYCPEWLAETGDPVGLHIGTLDKPTENVMATLDVRPEVAAKAIEEQIDLIIAKHPPVFRPVKRLTAGNFREKMYADLLKHDIAIYTVHVNMDIIDNGLNDWFCKLSGIRQTTFLTEAHTVPYKKLAVFVPIDEAPQMREALGLAGAGSQGNYSKASHSLIEAGRFTPTQGTNPAIGKIGQESVVQETEIEVISPETKQEQVLTAMLQAHPYEEPVYDVYTIENQSKESGLGRVGILDRPVRLSDFVQRIKRAFQLDGLWVIAGSDAKVIQRIAICGESGEKFYHDALCKQTDVYITGDMYYHTAHDMVVEDLPVINPGHYIEALCKPKLVGSMNQWEQEDKWAVSISESEANTSPFHFE